MGEKDVSFFFKELELKEVLHSIDRIHKFMNARATKSAPVPLPPMTTHRVLSLQNLKFAHRGGRKIKIGPQGIYWWDIQAECGANFSAGGY